jgi:hypothetical protein
MYEIEDEEKLKELRDALIAAEEHNRYNNKQAAI